MRRLSIAIDLDGILADLHGRWLGMYNADFEENVSIDDMLDWDMAKNVKIGTEIYDYLVHPGLFLSLDPIPGAIEALQRLRLEGHELHIVSAPWGDPQVWADKVAWVSSHIPWMGHKNVTLTSHKHKFACDVFVDDSPENQRRMALAQPHVLRLGIAYPYNRIAEEFMVRMPSYKDPKFAWDGIVNAIDSYAKASKA